MSVLPSPTFWIAVAILVLAGAAFVRNITRRPR
jgi:hypothetical protein